MEALKKIKFVLDKIMEVLGILTLGAMSVLVCYQVFARYLFNSPSSISGTLSQYLFVWMIMFGSAYVYGSREHLTIDILKDKFSPKTYMVMEVITNVCLFIFIAVVCVVGGWLYTKGQVKQIDPSLHISKATMYISVPFTGIITLFYAINNSATAVYNYHSGKRTHGDELSGTA